jgi:hypothetical protein
MVASMATRCFVLAVVSAVLSACGANVSVDETSPSGSPPDCASAYPCTEAGLCTDNGQCTCFGLEDCWLGEPGQSEHVGYGACCYAASDSDCHHSELCIAYGVVCTACGDGSCGVAGCDL